MSEPETIVLVSIDDLRYDALGYSGLDSWLADYDATAFRHTPTFDALARQGTTFTHATSTSSYTPPSHGSMFSGKYPSDHGVKTFFNTYSPSSATIAGALRDAGYETKAWIENQALEALDVTRGFDEIVCPFEDDSVDLFEFVRSATDSGKRTFVFVHLFDVHKPYCYTPGGEERHQYNDGHLERIGEILPPEIRPTDLMDDARDEASDTLTNYEKLSDSLREYAHNWSLDYLIRQELEKEYGGDRFEYLVKLYIAGVQRFDTGRFADLIDLLDDALDASSAMFVTSDHGEARCTWRDREDFMNSFNVSEQAVRIPMIVDTDLQSLPSESDTPVSHIDIAPTIAELVEDVQFPDVEGKSLKSLAANPPSERTLYHESWYYEGGVDFFGEVSETGEGGLSEIAVRQFPYKLTVSKADSDAPDVALYDLSTDPFETQNLYDEQPVAEELEETLDTYLDGIDETCTSDLDDDEGDELEDRLRALGYLN